jgi:hypothetical protein
MTFAAQVEDGTVVQVIVGDAAWANSRLDGDWYDSDVLVGIGWTYTDGTFTPPPAPEIDEAPDAGDA